MPGFFLRVRRGSAMKKFFVVVALATTMLGCTTAQIAQVEADIQAGTAALCGVIPTVTSILDVVEAVTGTSVFTGLTNTTIAAIEADICSAAPTPASARYRSIPLRSSGRLPVVIGQTQHGIVVTGWR